MAPPQLPNLADYPLEHIALVMSMQGPVQKELEEKIRAGTLHPKADDALAKVWKTLAKHAGIPNAPPPPGAHIQQDLRDFVTATHDDMNRALDLLEYGVPDKIGENMEVVVKKLQESKGKFLEALEFEGQNRQDHAFMYRDVRLWLSAIDEFMAGPAKMVEKELAAMEKRSQGSS